MCSAAEARTSTFFHLRPRGAQRRWRGWRTRRRMPGRRVPAGDAVASGLPAPPMPGCDNTCDFGCVRSLWNDTYNPGRAVKIEPIAHPAASWAAKLVPPIPPISVVVLSSGIRLTHVYLLIAHYRPSSTARGRCQIAPQCCAACSMCVCGMSPLVMRVPFRPFESDTSCIQACQITDLGIWGEGDACPSWLHRCRPNGTLKRSDLLLAICS